MPNSTRPTTLLLAAAIAALTGLPLFAQSTPPPTPAPAASSQQPSQGLEEIIVTGLRASLEKSLDIKKDAPVVLDSINATELGRFPDADVADSLAHLPGITLNRTTGGEGVQISVRGLGSQYNIVSLNNRILASDDDGRDLAFDVLPSEVISGADVLKSSQASALEGSIGGTVNLRTASPFDNPGFHVGAHAEANTNEMTDLHGSKYSAFVEDTIADQTMGFLIGAVHSDDNLRTDSLNAYNEDIYGPTTYPFEGGPNTVPVSEIPCCITFGSIYDNKKRDALSGSFQWRPTSEVQLTGDVLYTRLRDPQLGYNQSYYWDYTTDQNGNPNWVNPTINNGLVTAVTANQFQPEIVNNTINRNVDTWEYGLNGRWQPTPKLSLALDVYRSTADRPEGGTDTFVTAGLVTDQPYAVDTLIMSDVPHSLPNLNVIVPPSQLGLSACPSGTASTVVAGSCSYTALMNSGFLNNNKYWSTHYVGLNGFSVTDQINSAAFDGTYLLNQGPFTRLLFGLGDSNREKRRTDSSNDWTNGSGQYGTLYQTAGGQIQPSPYSFGSQGFNVITMTNPPNFMHGAGGSYPSTLPKLNSQALIAFLQSLNGKPNPFYCQSYPTQCDPPYTTFNYADTVPQPNPFNSYDVTEKTTSLYFETEFAGSNWSGNAGVRVVRTADHRPLRPVGAGVAVDPDHRRLHANLERAIRHLAIPVDQRRLHAGAAVGEPQLLAGAAATAAARRGRRNHGAPGSQSAGAKLHQQCRERHARARLHRYRGTKAHQGHAGRLVAGVVLRTAFGAHRGRVRKAPAGRHLYRHPDQRQSGHAAIRRRTAWHGTRDAVPVDDH